MVQICSGRFHLSFCIMKTADVIFHLKATTILHMQLGLQSN